MINRCDSVKAAGTTAAAAAIGDLLGCRVPAQGRQPNIIFIMADPVPQQVGYGTPAMGQWDGLQTLVKRAGSTADV